jgi:hypothetical protein
MTGLCTSEPSSASRHLFSWIKLSNTCPHAVRDKSATKHERDQEPRPAGEHITQDDWCGLQSSENDSRSREAGSGSADGPLTTISVTSDYLPPDTV